jgi:hypothetical protein
VRIVAGGLHIGVVEHDDRCVAAEFEVHAGQRFSGGAGYGTAGVDISGDGDRVDVGVAGERGAGGGSVAEDDVDHAGRQHVGGQFDDPKQRRRRELGRLDDARVAGRQGRGQFPGGHVHGVVPRRDERGDSEWFAPDLAGVVEQVLPGGLAEAVARCGGEEAPVVDDDVHLVPGGADGFSGDARFGGRQLVLVRLDEIGDPVQDFRALPWCGPRPLRECRTSRAHGLVDNLGSADHGLGEAFTGGRVDHRQSVGVDIGDGLTVNDRVEVEKC